MVQKHEYIEKEPLSALLAYFPASVFSSYLFPAQKSFFSRKSIKVSLFRGNNILNVWYIATYKNETFGIFYRKVSQKYHKIGRSIIKYGYESIKKAKKEVYTIPVL